MTRPLIGVEDLTTPSWSEGYQSVATDGLVTVARTVPRMAALAARSAWAASPRLTVLMGLTQLVTGVVTAFGLLATADVFTGLLQDEPTPQRVLAALPGMVLVVAAYAARALLEAGSGLVESMVTPQVERAAHDRLLGAVVEVELVAFDDADFAELVDRASMLGPSRLEQAVGATGDLTASTVSIVAAVVTAAVLHPLLAPMVVLAAVPQAWASVRSARVLFASIVRMNSHSRRQGVTRRLITGRDQAAEVRAFGVEEVLMGEQRRIAADLTAEAVRVARVRTFVNLVGRTLSGVGAALAYVVLGILLWFGLLELAYAGAAVLAMRTATSSVSTSIFSANRLYEATFFVDLYRRCLTDAAARARGPATAELRADPETIRLAGVSFTYPGQDDRAVDGVDVTMRRGEVIALVGENGSGKSTLAKLITGLYLPESGTVTWDDVDTAALDPHALHDRVAVVLQDPVRWPMTAANNVRIGRLARPDPRDTRLADAAGRSGADVVAAELPAGWETVLSREFQGGRDLSGGQWQRISVARGLYRDAPVVIADEPTAALDARAENAVFTSLRGLGGAHRITVLVTHRLANVRHADQILVLDKGKLVERGTHEQLMECGGTYHELFGLQASAYGPGPDTVTA